MSTPEFRAAKRVARDAFRPNPNVVTIYVGEKSTGGVHTGETAVVFNVIKKLPKELVPKGEMIPPRLTGVTWRQDIHVAVGVPTDVVEVGAMPRALYVLPGATPEELDALAVRLEVRPESLTARRRPCSGGFSIGAPSVTAGTLGAWVKRGTSEQYHILTNNHVAANTNKEPAGTDVLQPGPYDRGTVGIDTIATLTAFVKINFPGGGGGGGSDGGKKKCGFFLLRSVKDVANAIARAVGCQNRLVIGRPLEIVQPDPNLVDAAVAAVLDPAYVKDEIEFLGPVNGIRDPKLGEAIAKVGRTTELKRGTVIGVDAWSKVDYGPEGVTEFDDQVLFGPGGFSAGGDSGSAILTEDNYLTALLFAGSDQVTLGNRISNVVALLGVRL